jgi:hypothetical protein
LVSNLIFIGLIYLVLFVVVLAVRREMRQHIDSRSQLPAAAPGRLQIIQSGSDGRLRPGQFLSLRRQMTLGASAENEIVVNDRFVSGRHARLAWDGTRWSVTDLGSTNGTFINGQRCTPHKEHIVPRGATLQIGHVVLRMLE